LGYATLLTASAARTPPTRPAGSAPVTRASGRSVVIARRRIKNDRLAISALAGPLAWNMILRAAHGNQFFTDAPIAVLPASWQDTGSGVFTIAVTALALGIGPLAAGTGRRIAAVAALDGLSAFLVDVYLY
jgi:hypothetical protein